MNFVLKKSLCGCPLFLAFRFTTFYDIGSIFGGIIIVILSLAVWPKYLPIAFALGQMFVYFLKGIPAYYSYKGYALNISQPILLYIITKSVAFLGLVSIVIYDQLTSCDRIRDQAKTSNDFESQADSCDEPTTIALDVIVNIIILLVELHFIHIVISYYVRLRRGEWGVPHFEPDHVLGMPIEHSPNQEMVFVQNTAVSFDVDSNGTIKGEKVPILGIKIDK